MHLFVGKFCSNLGIDLYLQLFDVQNMLLEWLFCGAYYLNLIIHHFITVPNHKYFTCLNFVKKRVMIVYEMIVTILMFGSSVWSFQFRSSFRPTEFWFWYFDTYSYTLENSFIDLNVFLVRLNISITQIFCDYKEYDFDGGLLSFYMGGYEYGS